MLFLLRMDKLGEDGSPILALLLSRGERKRGVDDGVGMELLLLLLLLEGPEAERRLPPMPAGGLSLSFLS